MIPQTSSTITSKWKNVQTESGVAVEKNNDIYQVLATLSYFLILTQVIKLTVLTHNVIKNLDYFGLATFSLMY